MAKDHPTGNSGLYQAFLQLKTDDSVLRALLEAEKKSDD